jgi:hypothetical protein
VHLSPLLSGFVSIILCSWLGYGLDKQGSFPSGGNDGTFFCATLSRLALGPPKPCPLVSGGSFTGVKWPGHEVDHLPPSSAEIKNV